MRTRHLTTGAIAFGLGAALTYFFDPRQGRRRRALVRNKALHTFKQEQDLFDKARRDLANRARGAVQRARTPRQASPDDAVIIDRVRAALGRVASHPSAIFVECEGGCVVLSGAVLEGETREVIRCVEAVPGVRFVINELEPHATPAGVPELQGHAHLANTGWRRDTWAPAPRVAAGLAGAALLVGGRGRASITASLARTAGAALLLRSVINQSWKHVVGLGADRRGIAVQKTITVAAPIDEVFALWSRLENFPRFMDHVKRIVADDSGHSHWEVDGPGGIRLGFDAQTTRFVPNRLIAWETVPHQIIEHRGSVHFESVADGGTRIHVQMRFNPPAGALGHSVAKIFGWDPKARMDEDLVRMKGLLEHGRARAHGQRVTIDDLV